ncbi:hypothetical protein D3C71_1939130 [compost metagenome]
MHVKPASGREIPDPEKGGYLPAEGREVEQSTYWLRRIADGDVVEVKPGIAESDELAPAKKGAKQ